MKMSNQLFNQFQNSINQNLMKQFEQFRKNFIGNPQQKVQELLNSGKMSQQQFNQLQQMAQNLFGCKF